MSDTPRKRRDNPEHRFQSWADRLIDRVVLPPMFTSGIDHGSHSSAAAWARMTARGVKAGLPDMVVCQRANWPLIVWLELKRGTPVSPAQEGVHKAMRDCRQPVFVCRTMSDIVAGLREAGFCLHANAEELALEYEARCEVKQRAPRSPSKPRNSDSKARIRRAAAIYANAVLSQK